MVNITVTISDDVDSRLREFLWNKYKGKGKHMGEEISQAISEYIDRQERSSAKKRS
jgi:hypothetical protein